MTTDLRAEASVNNNELILDVWIKPVMPLQYCTITFGDMTEEQMAIFKEVLDEVIAEFNAENPDSLMEYNAININDEVLIDEEDPTADRDSTDQHSNPC